MSESREGSPTPPVGEPGGVPDAVHPVGSMQPGSAPPGDAQQAAPPAFPPPDSPQEWAPPPGYAQQPGYPQQPGSPQPPAGYSQPAAYPQWGEPQPAPWSALAIVGFIVSFFVGVVGVILSIFGLRETSRTGKRGRGLAIAGIIVGAIATLSWIFLIVLFAAVMPLIVRGLESAGAGQAGAESSAAPDAVAFGQYDTLPAAGIPQGVHQGLVDQGWTPEKGSPSAAYFQLKDDDDLPAYDDPTGACTAYVDMYTSGFGVDSERDESQALLKGWIEDPNGPSKLSGEITVGQGPAFVKADTGGASADGLYDVALSSFDPGDGSIGEVRARVFSDSGEGFGVVTAVICDDAKSLDAIGAPALENVVGAAW